MNKDTWHRISDIDKDTMTGICSQCGPVVVQMHPQRTCYVCSIKEHERVFNKGRRALCKRYGITIEQYNSRLKDQNGRCAICEKECTTGRMLAVDHDHSCCPGKKSCGTCVRGLLCAWCNQRLGMLENEIWVDKAMRYLENT